MVDVVGQISSSADTAENEMLNRLTFGGFARSSSGTPMRANFKLLDVNFVRRRCDPFGMRETLAMKPSSPITL